MKTIGWVFLRVLISGYRANPVRPRCAPGRHVLGCRLLGLTQVRGGKQDCPEKGD